MKNIHLITIGLALLAVPGLASAKDYASPGTIEAGGIFGIISESTTEKPEEGDEEFTATTTAVVVQPTVGYFVTDGLELIGQLNVVNASFKPDEGDGVTLTTIGLGAGAGYFVNMGSLRVGPQLILRFGNETLDLKDFDIKQTEAAVGASVGVFAKVPIGGGGVIAAGLALDYDQLTLTQEVGDTDFDASGTRQDIGARVGYFVFF